MKFFASKNDGLDAKTLTLPLALEAEQPPQLFAYVVTGCFIFLGAFVIWAFVTSVLEVTHATGQIQPQGSVQTIQHLEGGYIDKILVSEGDRVLAGQPIVRLRPTATESERDQLAIRAASLRMSQASLEALINEQEIVNLGRDASLYVEIAQSKLGVFLSEKERIERELAKYGSQLARRKAEYNAALSEHKSSVKRVEIAKEQYEILAGLLKQQYASRRSVLEAEAALEEARSRLYSLDGKISTTREQVREAQIQLDEARAKIFSDLAKEKSENATELAEVDRLLTKQQDRVQSLDLVAPTNGIVQELPINTIGAVVRSGEVVARIVPDDRNILAEVRVKPKDIGHIHQGADAKVTISTFDPYVFGSLEGKVKTISATSFEDEKDKQPYFKVQIALDTNEFKRKGMSYPVLPGMVVTADIVTGSKSLARYLLKPVYRSMDVAFSER
ncbi:HlyD family type I secretion periplasmic adaptor subunit [uncultured Cohaesibacter sp.]|uniref:HlyD family type I secretion periplasmic adaptor subunit n=1 Tax=uncultured Cohaesibacter sp. TaxID=1002546 RepID=UPI00292F9CDB|nr:HlyD family type I secretion periplasmic adaptor subunit [uncultured Cohaesibacter sp.]